jgi:outer membrane protein assembly factor BamB
VAWVLQPYKKANIMSSKLAVVLYIFLPFAVFGQSSARPVYPIDESGPFARVYYPENNPDATDSLYFPARWKFVYGSPEHNAAFPVSQGAPEWLKEGVSWKYAEARSWPLEQKDAFGEQVYGEALSLSTITQSYANAVGVTAVGGVIYAESDDMFAYALNAKTGKLIWRTSPISNNLMGYPLVVGDLVYISTGSVAFNFENLSKYAKKGTAKRGEGIAYNGVYALDRRTGRLVWYFLTDGDAMPTPAFDNNKLYISTGDGFLYCIDALSGKKIWQNELGGMSNMSSPVVEDSMVYTSLSVKAFIYGINAQTGKVVWKGTIPGAANTGVGDVSPVVSAGVVVLDAVSDERTENGKQTMNTALRAFDAKTGKVLWTTTMGRGPKPHAFKGGVPMIHDSILYVGSPVNSMIQAYGLRSGKVLWQLKMPNAGRAGAGRGAGTYYNGTLYISTGQSVYAIDPSNGKIIGSKEIGGRFGIVSPTIVGGMMYLANSWDWIIAIPVSSVNPAFKL